MSDFDDDDAEKKGRLMAGLMEQLLGGGSEVEFLGATPVAGRPGRKDDRSPDGIGKMSILPEAAIERLKAYADRYQGENPFRVGDLVTVRSDAPLDGKGIPHIVVEVGELPDNPAIYSEKYLGTPFYGARYNIRTATVTEVHSNIVCYWMDWTDLVPYTGEGVAEATDKTEAQ